MNSFSRKDTILSLEIGKFTELTDIPDYDREDHPELNSLSTFLSELSFLTLFWGEKRKTIKNPIVLYGVPLNRTNGYHVEFLSDLFPEIEFHCYSSKWNPKNEKIKTHSEKLTSDVLKEWKDEEENILLITDVFGEMKDVDEYIQEFNSWFDVLTPIATLVHMFNMFDHKIREGVYFLKPFTFFENKTAYVIPGKTEIGALEDTSDAIDYHYMTVRKDQKFNNPFTNDSQSIYAGVSNSFDIRYMTQIFIDYLLMRGTMNYDLVISFYQLVVNSLFNGVPVGINKNAKVDLSRISYTSFIKQEPKSTVSSSIVSKVSSKVSQQPKSTAAPSLISSINQLIDFYKKLDRFDSYLDIGSCRMDINTELIKRYQIRNSFVVDHIGKDLFTEYYKNEMINYNINYIQYDMKEQIPMPTNSIDLVTMLLYAHHRSDQIELFISDVSRVLKVGGCLIIQEHDIVGQETYDTVASAHRDKKYHNLTFMEKQIMEERKERKVYVERPKIGSTQGGKVKNVLNRIKLKSLLQKNRFLYISGIETKNDPEKKYVEMYIKQ